ncbi:MAG TPA: zinc ABC transporter substrate-binding protein [Phycisphaerales bacterium]|nr:zinc ABC transporter substrate-binding protein [Phycisphaerales bacterium]
MAMTQRYMAVWSLAALATVLPGCGARQGPARQAEVAVTNSYLAAAVRDLCGDDMEVLCLAPPGMCPGHFDISPSQVEQLCRTRLLLLFDFQTQVEASLSRIKQRGVKTAFVKSPGALCLPQAYRAICDQVAAILSDECPDIGPTAAQRMASVESQVEILEAELPDAVRQAGLTGAEVLASRRQAEFARWLGLEVVAEFVGSDIETVSNVDACLKKAQGRDIRFVIANRQEGTALAESLADRLGARPVVFTNFPEDADGPGAYAAMVRANVAALIEAAR